MKQILIALVLCATSAMAFGQTVSCEACTHDVSVYMGDGGLIAEADGADTVTYVSTCGGVTQSGELEPGNDGVVMMQFMDSGLVCNAATSRLQLGPVKDGGWHWITDDTNSAVGSLVNQDVLGNTKAEITNPGPGVTMREGRGAVLVKETATGRLALLPNVLPEPPEDDPPMKCGRSQSRCTLGDGGAMILATSTDDITDTTVLIADKSTVTRPAGTGAITIIADLWMNGSGHLSNDPNKPPGFGQPESVMSDFRSEERLTGVTYAVAVSPAGSALTDGSSTAVGGVKFASASDAATITVEADTAYCARTANVSLPVTVTATMTADDAKQVTPFIQRSTTGVVAATGFTIACPAASAANQGQELVPDNPFSAE